MNIELKPGRYIVAVSGGVDSVALLHAVSQLKDVQLTVAHYDHGIRSNSSEDCQFVEQTAERYGLSFVYDEGRLGSRASEDMARKARYHFLHTVRSSTKADAVLTAHHRDDVLETAIINLIRGTGRKGLSSLQSTDTVVRPLLHHTKQEIQDYARQHGLQWREDDTNTDPAYLRNHIRHNVVPRLSEQHKHKLHGLVQDVKKNNSELDSLLNLYLDTYTLNDGRLDRRAFILLPHAVSREVLASWLRRHGIRQFDARAIERLVHAAKISEVGKRVNVSKGAVMEIGKDSLALAYMER